MKRHQKQEDQLGILLKKHGLMCPSEEYSSQLRNLIVNTYGKRVGEKEVNNNWVVNAIFIMAIVWTLLFLYFFNPFSVQPVLCFSVLAFTIGLTVLIWLIRQNQVSL
jgi:hypothetical protein